jgi:phage terminase large subunit-like protein
MAAAARELEHARDYAGIAHKYARDVLAGRVVACKWVKLACKRHLDDLKRSRKGWEFYFDPWHADDVCDFAEKMPHVEGVWDSATIVLEPPQIFMLAAIFGWRRRSDKLRRFSAVYIEMARKGAKSTLTAIVGIYCLCCEDEPGAQVVIGATTGEQAGKVFNPAKRMIERTRELQEAFDLKAWARSITCGTTGGFIQPINSKGKTQDGWNPHVGILDELHAHQSRDLFDVITSAFGSRRNPLRWVITTAGYNTNGVCYEQHTYVRKILEATLEAEHYFGIIFTLDEGDNLFDPKVWVKANPMLGITPTLASMESEATDAKASPASEGEFQTKRLNIWRNALGAWLNVAQWLSCGDETLDWADFEGLDCWIGGDLADKNDITALALVAFDAQGRLIFKPKFWLPEATLALPEHSDGRAVAPYRLWVNQRHLHLTPGDWVDHNEVEAQVREWHQRFRVLKVTFDQFAAATAMASRLNEDLATPDNPLAVILHKKASAVTDPAKELEARVRSGPSRLRHDNNPVMNWMASNVVVAHRRDESILPIKESPMSPNKIDGIDALVNGLAPAVMQPDPEPSYSMFFVGN